MIASRIINDWLGIEDVAVIAGLYGSVELGFEPRMVAFRWHSFRMAFPSQAIETPGVDGKLRFDHIVRMLQSHGQCCPQFVGAGFSPDGPLPFRQSAARSFPVARSPRPHTKFSKDSFPKISPFIPEAAFRLVEKTGDDVQVEQARNSLGQHEGVNS